MVTLKQKTRNAPFRAIADPTRRDILSMLRIGPKNVGELARNFQMSRPAVSKHLRLLRSTGLITTQKRGATHICRLSAKPLRAVSLWVRDYEMFWGENLRGLKKYIEGAANQKRGDR